MVPVDSLSTVAKSPIVMSVKIYKSPVIIKKITVFNLCMHVLKETY